jgi:hypothetical protein
MPKKVLRKLGNLPIAEMQSVEAVVRAWLGL